MYDHEIRKAFYLRYLDEVNTHPNTKVVNELGIKHGGARADIAVLNGRLEGFEIKSERDSLVRLERQIAAYDSIFQRSSIIACEKFIPRVMEIVPEWWGVYVATSTKANKITFKKLRSAKLNYTSDKLSIAQLLWRDEALDAAKRHTLEKLPSSAPRRQIYSCLVDNLSKDSLYKVVLTALKQRDSWRADRSTLLSCDDYSQLLPMKSDCQFSQ